MKSRKSGMKTLKIPYSNGRICYITDHNSECEVTIECYALKKAFHFPYSHDSNLSVGDWVKFCGTTRVNTKIQKNGKNEEKIRYYHKPHDGSSVSGWVFFELQNVEVKMIAPPDINCNLEKSSIQIQRHLESWVTSLKPVEIKETISSLENTINSLKQVLIKQEILNADREHKMLIIDIAV